MIQPPAACPECGTELGPRLIECPSCRRLVYANDLELLAGKAERAERAHRLADALESWNEAIALLPAGSRQREHIEERIRSLNREVEKAPRGAAAKKHGKGGAVAKGAAGVGALGLFLWKFKSVGAFLLTKGKFLVAGLANGGAFLSMLASFWLYLSVLGWEFGLGLMISLYFHELGHVVAMQRYGLQPSAPMFVPGLGAFVRGRASIADPRVDALVALAGPRWGLITSAIAAGVFLGTEWALVGAIARIGAWLNLLNLVPFWILDGGRAIQSLSRRQAWILAAVVGATTLWTADGVVLGLVVGWIAVRAFGIPADREGDRRVAIEYTLIATALSLLTLLTVQI